MLVLDNTQPTTQTHLTTSHTSTLQPLPNNLLTYQRTQGSALLATSLYVPVVMIWWAHRLFTSPKAGSPKTSLLHVTPSVCSAVLYGFAELEDPYRTSCVPLKSHCPFSAAQSIHLFSSTGSALELHGTQAPSSLSGSPGRYHEEVLMGCL